MAFVDEKDKPLASWKLAVMPRVGDEDFLFLRRTVTTDERGTVKIDRVVPGLSYHIQDVSMFGEPNPTTRPGGPLYDEVMVLLPSGKP